MFREHLDAVRGLIADVSRWPVHKSVLLSPQDQLQRSNYVIVFARRPAAESERFTKTADAGDRRDFDVPFKVVGVTADAVEGALDRLEALEGQHITVAGRSCSPLRWGTEPVLTDSSVKPPLFFADCWVRFSSRPA